MLLRNKKEHDVNEGKWIGVGGKFLDAESPEECLIREVKEETGLILDDFQCRGILTFVCEGWEMEYIHVFTATKFHGSLQECNEGELRWIKKNEIMQLNLWEGDRIFLPLLLNGSTFFSLKLIYQGEQLIEHVLHQYESI